MKYEVVLQRKMFGYASIQVEADPNDTQEDIERKACQMGLEVPHQDWETPKEEILEEDLMVVSDPEVVTEDKGQPNTREYNLANHKS